VEIGLSVTSTALKKPVNRQTYVLGVFSVHEHGFYAYVAPIHQDRTQGSPIKCDKRSYNTSNMVKAMPRTVVTFTEHPPDQAPGFPASELRSRVHV
jgi:hypothetical protein